MSSNASEWRKARASGDGGSCVEVRCLGDVVEVRDTKDRQGGTLRLSVDQWRDLIEWAVEDA